MRIISGLAGGIRLRAPAGSAVRPTTDRVKESLFGGLGPLAGRRVVDLFSGTGALGLEALSRGAAGVALVERDRRVLACLRDNAERVLKAIGADAGELRILPGEVAAVPRLLADWAGRVDIILADPPYQPPPQAYGAAALLTDAAFADWAGEALLVLEHAAETVLPWHPAGGLWQPTSRRSYGSLQVTLARRVAATAGAAGAAPL